MQVTVDLVPYDVKVEKPKPGEIEVYKYTMRNFLGMDGYNFLKRKNPYNEPSGTIDHLVTLVNVSEDELEFICPDLESFLKSLDYLLDAYQSVGWECLNK